MATPTTQDMTTLVRNQVAAIQGLASKIVDFTIGSIMRALVEANASVGLWLQGLILTLLATTRLSTSSGSDVDSFVQDFGLARLPAIGASGLVTFSRFAATLQAIVPVGSVVQTADGTQTFSVTLDTSNPAYNPALGGYVLAVSVSSINVPVQANTPGAASNVQIGTIITLTTPISGVDAVTNAAAFTNGADAESDAAVRARFVTFIASLSKATKIAIGNAVLSVQQGLSYTLTENQLYNGTTQMGFFYVVVDDGTGSPPSPLLASVSNAIDAARPTTSTFAVFAPVVLTANVVMTIATGPGFTHSDVAATVKTALQSFINTLPLGMSLPFTRLAQVAYDASPGVTNVSGVTLNSGTADLTTTAQQVIKAGTVTVS